jgi:DNA polymerase III alpha subunit (gram-positive type)
MTYFCIDVEASGQLPPKYNLLSVGATVVRPEGSHHVLGDSFYVELKPIFSGFDPAALAVCGLDVDRLKREGLEPGEAMRKLSAWVAAQNLDRRQRPIFVGHNAVFDWAYIAYYYEHHEQENPFGYKAIESKSLAMGRLGIDWNATSKEKLAQLLDLPPLDPAQVHRADYDAWYQALILKALLDRRPA